MNRFNLVFHNSGSGLSPYNNSSNILASVGSNRPLSSAPRNLPLNAPMIDRVYKAKPGCGGCGKKVV